MRLADLPPEFAAIARAQLDAAYDRTSAGYDGTSTPNDRTSARRKVRKPRTPERVVLKDCLDALERFGIEHHRNNTGAVRIGGRFMRFGKPGSSDILGILPRGIDSPPGRFFACECKATGKKPTKLQRAYLERVAADGGLALVVDEVDSLAITLRRMFPGRG